ncbi:MAG: hypothetical protein LBR16_01370, partial [Treponema sp.]|nr:hypothetical protein [Treponema sp.]
EGKLFNCFASGEVTLPAAQTSYAGGIAGYHNTNARAEGCVALNTGISGKYTGRIGYKNGTVFGTNWGLDAVEKNGAAGAWTSDETGKDGAAVSAEECALEAWWRDNADWDSVWGLSDDAPWQWNGEAQRPYFWFE